MTVSKFFLANRSYHDRETLLHTSGATNVEDGLWVKTRRLFDHCRCEINVNGIGISRGCCRWDIAGTRRNSDKTGAPSGVDCVKQCAFD